MVGASLSRKTLIFPSYLGSGFGHIGRCLALADALRTRGWETAFVLAGPHVDQVRRAGHQAFEPRKPFRPRAEGRGGPAYTCISNMNYQIVRDGFHRPRTVRACLKEEMRFIKRFHPDVLIGDTWPLTWILGQRLGLPVVQIVRSIIHPAAPQLIWWRDVPDELISPDVRPVFNPLLRRWGLPEINRAEDLLRGDLLLIPSIPELDPLPDGLPGTHYIGALICKPHNGNDQPGWLQELDAERPVIYVTIGGGAGPVGNVQFFDTVNEAVSDTDWQVIVSTSRKFDPIALPTPSPNVQYHAWVPGPAVIARSDVVVFHGGYGTTMETICYGLPSVIIPFHSEQEANGRRLEASGAARLLTPVVGPSETVRGRWPGGNYTILIWRRSALTPAKLRSTISKVLEEPGYRQNARRLQADAARYGGPAQAAELVASLLH